MNTFHFDFLGGLALFHKTHKTSLNGYVISERKSLRRLAQPNQTIRERYNPKNADQKLLWILASNKKRFDLSVKFQIMHRGITKSVL